MSQWFHTPKLVNDIPVLWFMPDSYVTCPQLFLSLYVMLCFAMVCSHIAVMSQSNCKDTHHKRGKMAKYGELDKNVFGYAEFWRT